METHFIKEYLCESFDLHNKKIYCQVATYANQIPQIRTMHLHDVSNEGELIFLTDTSTNKWCILKNNPRVAICLYEHPKQVIIGADVTLGVHASNFVNQVKYGQKITSHLFRDGYFLINKSVI